MNVWKWIKCNLFNIHPWLRMGDKDLYSQSYWRCCWCQRVKHTDCNQALVDKKRKEK